MSFQTLFFDLDDTLYPPSTGLWDAIRDRMNDYMDRLLGLPREEITALRQSYLEKYGTTLRGLQQNYHVDADEYLAYVHDLPLQWYIRPDPRLRELLLSLPQKRWIFTNSDSNHVQRVTQIIGVSDCFDGVIDIRALSFVCKPDPQAYRLAMHIAGVEHPQHCVLFDDAPRNLAPAKTLGMYTVLVDPNGPNDAAIQSIGSLHDLPREMPDLWDHLDPSRSSFEKLADQLWKEVNDG